ncbi:MAG: bifunctional UDP-N-acetylmuramoyl-tripeptide:D-alanyl-D-alanine ligase/alanine racemase [Ferruginibacter sp.]
MLFSQIINVLGIESLQFYEERDVQFILTDSRKLILPGSTVFFAFNSAHKNAHQFLEALYQNGVRNFIVKEGETLPEMPEANIIVVQDVLTALQVVTGFHRHQFQYPVIAITGSNGKTIVKEWLYILLQDDFQIIRSPRSYNSQVGVPLSLWQMEEQHNLALIEAGISHAGEMQALQKIIDPDIGLITFMGVAHAEGFENFEEKIREKLQLFTHAKVLIYCKDEILLHKNVQDFQKKTNPGLKLFSWSGQEDADLRVSVHADKAGKSRLEIFTAGEKFEIIIPFTDKASIHNALTCCALLIFLGIKPENISEKMQRLRAVEMRLDLKQGIHHCAVVNDSYSADINSLNIALDFMFQLPGSGRHTLILSDLLEAGMSDDALYHKISRLLSTRKFFRFIGVGHNMKMYSHLFNFAPNTSFYTSTDELVADLPHIGFNDEIILLKGARSFAFEKISHRLEEKVHETQLEIDLNGLRHNFLLYRKLLPSGVKIMAMVKALSYGSGSFEVASVLQHTGADYLGVAYADEGVDLRKAGIHLPIMVMNTEIGAFDSILNADLQPEIYSLYMLEAFSKYLDSQGIQHYPVHIKLDTGMHRLGFQEADIPQMLSTISHSSFIRIISVFSHLIASDDQSQDKRTADQYKLFSHMADRIEEATGYEVMRHIANTTAIHRHAEMQEDMVRLGIGLYGINADAQMQGRLQNVTTLKTTVSQVKKARKGETVGYGGKLVLEREYTIAVVRIGYADGYPRTLGNGKGSMWVKGKLAPVIGNVCMDMTMLDVTGLDVNEEDEVIVFGADLPVADLASWAGTIPYEILTNISERVKRVYFEE